MLTSVPPGRYPLPHADPGNTTTSAMHRRWDTLLAGDTPDPWTAWLLQTVAAYPKTPTPAQRDAIIAAMRPGLSDDDLTRRASAVDGPALHLELHLAWAYHGRVAHAVAERAARATLNLSVGQSLGTLHVHGQRITRCTVDALPRTDDCSQFPHDGYHVTYVRGNRRTATTLSATTLLASLEARRDATPTPTPI